MQPDEHNQQAWDRLSRTGHRFSRPPTEAEFEDPLQTVDGLGWLGSNVQGVKCLCLAAGGGRQGPLYAAAGAIVTVVDLSGEQLEHDRRVAQDRGLRLRTIQTSMNDLSMLDLAEFDLVVQPVSTCYVSDLKAVYEQVHCVLKPGGLYISQHKSPISLQAERLCGPEGGYRICEPYYRDRPLPTTHGSRLREEGTLEYLHRWEQLIGLLCRSGFVIEDLVEPFHADTAAISGSFEHRSQFVAPYLRLKARRNSDVANRGDSAPVLWTP